jgi:hypothetical protein
VLFPGTGSVVVDETDAVLVSVVAWAGAVTTRVIVGAVVPVARVGRVQVTETLPVFVQTQPVPVAETKVTPAGQGVGHRDGGGVGGAVVDDDQGVRDGAVGVTVALGPVLVIARSAEAVTVVLATEVLLAGFGSAVVEDTDAVLDSTAAWFGRGDDDGDGRCGRARWPASGGCS